MIIFRVWAKKSLAFTRNISRRYFNDFQLYSPFYGEVLKYSTLNNHSTVKSLSQYLYVEFSDETRSDP